MKATQLRGRISAPFFFLCAPLALLHSPVLRAEPWRPFVEADSFAHAEPVSIHAYINDWDGPLQSGSDAVTHNRLEIGVRHGAWSYGYVQRYDYEIKATRDAAVLYHQVKNKAELVPGTEYDLDVRAYHHRSQGLRLAFRQGGAHWSVEPGLSLLSGQKLINGRIDGQATALGGKEYAYNAAVNYYYSEDVLFDRQVKAPSGEGFALDLRLDYRPDEHWRLSFVGQDLYGFLRWRDAPVTEAVATSDTREFDEDGFVRFRPTLTGREFNESYSQRLHPRGLLAADWAVRPDSKLGLRLRLTEVRQYWSLTAGHEFASGLSTDLEFMPDLLAFGGGLRYSGFRFALMADKLKFEDARVLQLQLGWAYPF